MPSPPPSLSLLGSVPLMLPDTDRSASQCSHYQCPPKVDRPTFALHHSSPLLHCISGPFSARKGSHPLTKQINSNAGFSHLWRSAFGHGKTTKFPNVVQGGWCRGSKGKHPKHSCRLLPLNVSCRKNSPKIFTCVPVIVVGISKSIAQFF